MQVLYQCQHKAPVPLFHNALMCSILMLPCCIYWNHRHALYCSSLTYHMPLMRLAWLALLIYRTPSVSCIAYTALLLLIILFLLRPANHQAPSSYHLALWLSLEIEKKKKKECCKRTSEYRTTTSKCQYCTWKSCYPHKATHPSCWFRLPPLENINISMNLYNVTWLTSSH